MSLVNLPFFSFLCPNPTQMEIWRSSDPPSRSFITDLGLKQIVENLGLDQKSRWVVEELFYRPCSSE